MRECVGNVVKSLTRSMTSSSSAPWLSSLVFIRVGVTTIISSQRIRLWWSLSFNKFDNSPRNSFEIGALSIFKRIELRNMLAVACAQQFTLDFGSCSA